MQKLPPLHVVQDNSAVFQVAADTAVKAALAGNRNMEKSTACNNWDYTGVCSSGDKCTFSHDTIAGYKGTNAGDQTEDAGELNNELKECNNCMQGCDSFNPQGEMVPRAGFDFPGIQVHA